MSLENFDTSLYEVRVYDSGTQKNYTITVEATDEKHAMEVAETKGRYLEPLQAFRVDWD